MIETTVIILIVTSVVTLILNIFQSIKSNHFESNCSDCCIIKSDMETHEQRK